jgi:ABC-type transport system involved in multi-copper enzyme maturation permease subunit
MTTLTVPARPAQDDAGPRLLPWRRMAWVTWRQHRIALGGVAVFLGACAIYVWLNGLQLHNAYAAAAACHPTASLACSALSSRFHGGAFLFNGYNLQAIPPLIGAFAGAPVLAREMETGTFRYAWTQAFGRWRWTLAKLILIAIVVAAAAGAFSVLLSWYYQPTFAARNPALFPIPNSSLAATLFDLRGVAFAAWTLVAFAIGAMAGMLIRRVVPAIVATLTAYAGLAFAAGLYLRQHYLAPLVTRNLFSFFFNPPASAFIVHQRWTKDGTTLSQSTMNQVINSMFQRMMPVMRSSKEGAIAAQKLPTNLHVFHYLTQHGYTYWTSYQPGSRFWPVQWIEGGWLLTLSVLLIAATVWLVLRRAA